MEKIDQLCLALFDGWCERRSVIPLAYLMHAWPLLTSVAPARTRLSNVLQELQWFHPESLTPDEHQVIKQVLAIDAYAVKNSLEGSSP